MAGQSSSTILNDGRAYKATDQRNCINAFHSHPSAVWGATKDERLVIADYHLSVDQVYLDAEKRIRENDPNPWTVLTSVDHSADSPSLSGQRPSWVPRWDKAGVLYWLGHTDRWCRAGEDDAAPFRFELSNMGRALELPGIVLDSISWISRVFGDDELRLER